ncbi:GTP pyrophosphokinase [Dermabacteraceae bacterium P13101]
MTKPVTSVDEYREKWPQFVAAAQSLGKRVREILRDGGIDFRDVIARAKTVESLYGKLAREGFGEISDVHDLLGVRVVCNVEPDIARVADSLSEEFTVVEVRDKSREVRERGEIGYSGLHLIVENEVACRAEIQIRTILQDAWAQFEHGVRYKPVSGETSAEIDRSLTLASGLLELADAQFAKVQALQIEHSIARRHTIRGDEDERSISIDDLRDALLEALPGKRLSKKSHYMWGLQLLSAMGISSPAALRRFLAGMDPDRIREVMHYRYIPGPVRLLDDMLLLAFGEEYVARTKEIGEDPNRERKLGSRLAKINQA